jgi:nucleoside-diphosphate-sugar epimerase
MTAPPTGRNGAAPAPRRILVTGAAGFIGTALCRRLGDDGHQVHATWRTSEPTPAAGAVRWARVELTDVEAVDALVAGVRPDTVFHLAGLVTGSRDLAAVVPSFHQTLGSTVNVLTAAARHGCGQVLLAGSMEEPAPGDPPSSPYSAAKAAAHVYGKLFSALYGVDIVNLRVFMTYGPGQHDLTKLVPAVTLALLRGEVPPMSSGRRRVDWIYIDDLVDGMCAAAAAELPSGTTVDLGSGVMTSVADVAREIARQIGPGAELGLGMLPDRALEAEPHADVERTRRLTGWSATTSVADGVAATIEWCRTLSGVEVGRDR